jgi:PRTRC system protein C
MALEIKGFDRVFKYKGNELSDPDLSMSPEEVMKFYSNTYPELTNSNVYGPDISEDKAVYEFKNTVGTKG